MYDVKQFDPAEWTSPPTEARIVDKPPLGKVIVGRGAVNQKGPEAAVLAALHAIRGGYPRFSAAIDTCRIQSCNRFTASSCRLVISTFISERSPSAAQAL
jgi:hypothetical protein